MNFDAGFCEFRSLPTHTKPCTKLDLSQRGTTRTKNQSNHEHGPSSAHHHEPKHGIGGRQRFDNIGRGKVEMVRDTYTFCEVQASWTDKQSDHGDADEMNV